MDAKCPADSPIAQPKEDHDATHAVISKKRVLASYKSPGAPVGMGESSFADLRISEIRYRRLFEAARDGVLLVDPRSRKIVDANPFMIEILGYKHEQFVGKE